MNNLFKYVLVVILAVIASMGLLWADGCDVDAEMQLAIQDSVAVMRTKDSSVVTAAPATEKTIAKEEIKQVEPNEEKPCCTDMRKIMRVVLILLLIELLIAVAVFTYRFAKDKQKKKKEGKSFSNRMASYINESITQDGLTIMVAVIGALLVASIITFVYIFVMRCKEPAGLTCFNLTRFGLLGDFFGGFIGSFLAAIVAIYAVRTYKSERQLQKESTISAMLSTMLDLHKQNVKEITIINWDNKETTLTGRNAFKQLVEELGCIYLQVDKAIKEVVDGNPNKYCKWTSKESQMQLAHELSFGYFFYGLDNYFLTKDENCVLYVLCDEVREQVRQALAEDLRNLQRHEILGHYYRHLFNMVNYIDKNEFSSDYWKKENYIKMIRSQLSDYEEVLLYYDTLSTLGAEWNQPLGEENISEMNLICKYRLIKNCPNYIYYFGIKPSETYKVEKKVWDNKKELFFETDIQRNN